MTVALVRQAIFHALDEKEWDFTNDEQRVDFADMVTSFVPSAISLADEKRINWMQDNLALIRDIGWLAGQDLRDAIDAAMQARL